MALGIIHLVLSDATRQTEAVFYCGVEDAIVAIPPERVADFVAANICTSCLQAYRAQTQKVAMQG